jgi:hypothetical protein
VTLIRFLLFKSFGWLDALPLIVPSYFASAFQHFLMRHSC